MCYTYDIKWKGKGKEMQQKRPTQEYDQTLKALFGEEVAEILPLLLPEAEYLGEQNIEIDRSILKADLVYQARYRGSAHIVNMELQTSRDGTREQRLLMYHAGLHFKHALPILSVILYPFETSIPAPPYREQGGDGTLLTFEYKVLALWKLNASDFVQQHAVCLYTLLPAMQQATAPLLKQALQEMKQHYTRRQLGHHLIRFRRILQRSATMTEHDKREVEEELQMEFAYDWFLDENPEVLERVDKGRIEGEKLGLQKGEKLGLQRLAMTMIRKRFPLLGDQAQGRIEQIEHIDTLEQLILQLTSATTEAEVRQLLSLQAN